MEPGETTPRLTVHMDAEDDFDPAGSVAFSPDGTTLATGAGVGDIRFWDTRTGAEIGARVPVVSGWVLDLDWTPDGKSVLSSGTDGKVELIDSQARATSGLMPGIEGGVWVDAAVSPDGRRVVAAYDNGDAVDWSISETDWSAEACRVAGRTLTTDEWARYLPDRPYAPACTS
jgi:WD40 repeat protein